MKCFRKRKFEKKKTVCSTNTAQPLLSFPFPVPFLVDLCAHCQCHGIKSACGADYCELVLDPTSETHPPEFHD